MYKGEGERLKVPFGVLMRYSGQKLNMLESLMIAKAVKKTYVTYLVVNFELCTHSQNSPPS